MDLKNGVEAEICYLYHDHDHYISDHFDYNVSLIISDYDYEYH